MENIQMVFRPRFKTNKLNKGNIYLNVRRKRTTDEWVVSVSKNGKFSENETYYTDDFSDAIKTREVMKRRYEEQGYAVGFNYIKELKGE